METLYRSSSAVHEDEAQDSKHSKALDLDAGALFVLKSKGIIIINYYLIVLNSYPFNLCIFLVNVSGFLDDISFMLNT